MESYAVLRSFHNPICPITSSRSALVNLGGCWPTSSNSCFQGLTIRRNVTLMSIGKTSIAAVGAESDVLSDIKLQSSEDAKASGRSTFPNGFEALVLEVCDETEVAELKLKVGDFEMHLKRNVGAVATSLPDISPLIAPPIPSEPMIDSGPLLQTPPISSPDKVTPFINLSFGKSPKLATLEASGTTNYVLVSCNKVGTFRRNKTIKGKKQAPACKEGDTITEGQVIGYVDQFQSQVPVKSDVAGEVLKLLFDEGDAVGYGDPLMAVLPSFHDIK